MLFIFVLVVAFFLASFIYANRGGKQGEEIRESKEAVTGVSQSNDVVSSETLTATMTQVGKETRCAEGQVLRDSKCEPAEHYFIIMGIHHP
tara:strand:- start:766 stop:1038 length:273 start_codon:yes stop_codon:yes gene_type:complete